ncbi:GNAT family N-acetyltransferase [Streptomyces sp. NPDC001205]
MPSGTSWWCTHRACTACTAGCRERTRRSWPPPSTTDSASWPNGTQPLSSSATSPPQRPNAGARPARRTPRSACTAPAGTSLPDFADRIPSRKIRSEFLRQHRRGTDAGLRLTVVTGSELTVTAEEFTPDAQQTARRHGPALYGADIVTGLAGVPGAVALLAEHDDHGFAGGFWCFLHDGVFYLWAAAIHQDTKRDLHTYGWLMAEAVRYATAYGAHTIDAGRGNYRYKHRLGFTHTPLTSAVYLTAPDPGLVARLGVLDRDLTRLTHPTPATAIPPHRDSAPLRTETL